MASLFRRRSSASRSKTSLESEGAGEKITACCHCCLATKSSGITRRIFFKKQLSQCDACLRITCERCLQKTSTCHVCRIRLNTKLNSQEALRFCARKDLQKLARKLHFDKRKVKDWVGDELIIQILRRCNIPQEESVNDPYVTMRKGTVQGSDLIAVNICGTQDFAHQSLMPQIQDRLGRTVGSIDEHKVEVEKTRKSSQDPHSTAGQTRGRSSNDTEATTQSSKSFPPKDMYENVPHPQRNSQLRKVPEVEEEATEGQPYLRPQSINISEVQFMRHSIIQEPPVNESENDRRDDHNVSGKTTSISRRPRVTSRHQSQNDQKETLEGGESILSKAEHESAFVPNQVIRSQVDVMEVANDNNSIEGRGDKFAEANDGSKSSNRISNSHDMKLENLVDESVTEPLDVIQYQLTIPRKNYNNEGENLERAEELARIVNTHEPRIIAEIDRHTFIEQGTIVSQVHTNESSSDKRKNFDEVIEEFQVDQDRTAPMSRFLDQNQGDETVRPEERDISVIIPVQGDSERQGYQHTTFEYEALPQSHHRDAINEESQSALACSLDHQRDFDEAIEEVEEDQSRVIYDAEILPRSPSEAVKGITDNATVTSLSDHQREKCHEDVCSPDHQSDSDDANEEFHDTLDINEGIPEIVINRPHDGDAQTREKWTSCPEKELQRLGNNENFLNQLYLTTETDASTVIVDTVDTVQPLSNLEQCHQIETMSQLSMTAQDTNESLAVVKEEECTLIAVEEKNDLKESITHSAPITGMDQTLKYYTISIEHEVHTVSNPPALQEHSTRNIPITDLHLLSNESQKEGNDSRISSLTLVEAFERIGIKSKRHVHIQPTKTLRELLEAQGVQLEASAPRDIVVKEVVALWENHRK